MDGNVMLAIVDANVIDGTADVFMYNWGKIVMTGTTYGKELNIGNKLVKNDKEW